MPGASRRRGRARRRRRCPARSPRRRGSRRRTSRSRPRPSRRPGRRRASSCRRVDDEPVREAVRVLVVDGERVVAAVDGRHGCRASCPGSGPGTSASSAACRRAACHVGVVDVVAVGQAAPSVFGAVVGLRVHGVAALALAARVDVLEVAGGLGEADRRRGQVVVEGVDVEEDLRGVLAEVASARRTASTGPSCTGTSAEHADDARERRERESKLPPPCGADLLARLGDVVVVHVENVCELLPDEDRRAGRQPAAAGEVARHLRAAARARPGSSRRPGRWPVFVRLWR